eukprot:jgi/Ulvmu1/8040/UM004_0277.1
MRLSDLLILTLCVFFVDALGVDDTDTAFHGWLGEVAREEQMPDGSKRWLEVLSWPYRVFRIHNLLTPEECDHLRERAKPRLQRSSVVDTKNPAGQISNIRTSQGMFFARGETPTIANIEERIAQWVMMDKNQGEGFQVLYYKVGQKYDPHFDYFFHEDGVMNGGNRIATLLLYLTDVEEGGETVFPNVPVPEGQTAEHYSECAMQGLAVKPRRGDAAVFWSLTSAGTLNKGALHGGCPVIKGEKVSATKWYHVARYAMPGEVAERVEHVKFTPPKPPAPPGCKDAEYECIGWADSGECESNEPFMVGTREKPGHCILSCGRCDLMA